MLKASLGRRRPRHARRSSASRAARRRRSTRPGARPRPRSASDEVFLEKLVRRATPHRGAAPRRHARQPRPPVRARLLDPAAQPEGRRARAGALSRRRAARTSCATPRCKIGRAADYDNAGTVEFLIDADTGEFYFIEVNPRIQVEHTVTEVVTGIDIVKAQILHRRGRAARRRPRSACPTQDDDPAQRLRDPVPDHDRGPREQLHPRLRPDHRLPRRRRLRHPARRRHRLFRRGHHAASTTRCW